MGTSEQRTRPSILLWLAGFVVVFGGVSWFVSEGLGLHGAPANHSHPATLTPGPTPVPLDCPHDAMPFVGVFNECVSRAPHATATCSVSGHILDAVVPLAGANGGEFSLYIDVDGSYAGPSTYPLPPWPHPLGTHNDVPKVAVSQYGTGARWQSVAGALSVILEPSAGTNSGARAQVLSLCGPWRCS